MKIKTFNRSTLHKSLLAVSAIAILLLGAACGKKQSAIEPPDLSEINLYKKLILEKPDDIDLYYNLGTEYIIDGRYKHAIKELKTCINKDYEYVKAYNNLGYAYYRVKDYESARKTFYKGTLLNDQNGTMLYNLGLAEFQTGHYIDSLQHFKMAKHYSPELTQRVNDLMLVLPQTGY